MPSRPSPLGLLVPALCFFLTGCRHAAGPTEEEVHAAPVKAVAAEQAALGEWTELLGATQPLPGHVARLSTPVAGQVVSVLGDGTGQALVEGQQVAKGQIVVRLDDRVVRASRDKARALLDELDEQISQAGHDVELATIDVTGLEKLKERPSGASKDALVSSIDLVRARLALKSAESKQRLAQLKRKTAQADVKALDEELDLFALRAPIAGRLGTLHVAPGQSLSVGAPVAEIVDLRQIDVLCYAPANLVRRLALGQVARLAGDSEKDPPGKVTYIAVQAEADTGSFAVKARFPNPGLRRRAGDMRRLEVLTQPLQKRLLIPEAALLEDQDPPVVVVVEHVKVEKHQDKEERLGKARRLRAKLGVRQRGQQAELLGLTDPKTGKDVPLAGVLFVVEGGHGLHDGDLVKIEEEHHDEEAKKD